ncbi:MAG TPA: DUF5916 domain-containing protein, partial [Thermoanaerobaculia bacterium]|nr:DUF5916 domain-containing protein [Thermoanaerobaculia bacterium]
KIDGVLDEEAWKSALSIDLPYEWFPGDNATPPVKTEALITFDSDNLYVAFRCQDPDPRAIHAHLLDRDAIASFVQDDHVGVNLDTFNDERRAFQFRVNPFGVQADATFSEIDAQEDFSWDAIWSSAGRINADGWVVEFAIPFRELRFPRGAEPQTWGIEAFRSYPRNVRYRISSRFTDRAKDCTLCQENKVTGFAGITAGRHLELDPTLTAQRSDSRGELPGGELERGRVKTEPGLTARWGFSPNATVSATVNPDFSQVEADVAQLAINTRFALFYPEKRPFFLEGADLFLTPLQAVFTRTVADPDWGVKLNAKEAKDAVGLFVTRDSLNNLIIPANQGSSFAFLDEQVTSSALRYRRDVGERSAIGVLYTGRESGDYHNRVAGLDGFLQFTPSDTLRAQYLSSDTLYPRAVAVENRQSLDAFTGSGWQVQYDHFADRWKGFVRYLDLDPQFRADSGFIPRVDVKTAEGQYQRVFYGDPKSWFAQMSVGVHGLHTEDHSGRLTDQTAEVFGTYQGALQSSLEVHYLHNRTFFNGTLFDLDQQTIDFILNPTAGISFELYSQLGDNIDFDNTRKAQIVLLQPTAELRLGRSLNLNLSYQDQKLRVAGGQLYDAQLTQTRIIYQFDVRTFVRAIFQYTDIGRNPGLYLAPVDRRSKNFFTQLLFSYKINPQTVLFTGYTDTRLGVDLIPLTQTDRTFFVKLGYALID